MSHTLLDQERQKEIVDPSKVMTIHPSAVKLSETQKRFRQDMGDIKDLVKSIKEKGQIQPIVINHDYTLIAGGRRLAACIMGAMNVKAVFMDAVDPIVMRQLELEENIKRKAFTPAEEVLAMEEIHKMKQAQYGKTEPGKAGGWTLEDTAALVGKSRGSVISDLQMAEMLKAFPDLQNAKKKSDISKAAKAMEKVAANIVGLAKHETNKAQHSHLVKLDNADALEWMKTLPEGYADILLTDPPYGIEYQDVGMTIGGTGGNLTTSGFKFDDGKENALELYQTLSREAFRFTTASAHAYVFCGPEHFWTLRGVFESAGWLVHIKPLIWIKRSVGQCNVPSAWPASCYEMLMYCRKPASRLIKEGQPDWIECGLVEPSKRIHPTEKPTSLLENLIARSANPGATVVDPFAGSGSTLEAAFNQKCIGVGCEKLPQAYAAAAARIAGFLKGG
jgi:site-specific DNA-methyltransferase (adenine-specific)